MLLKEKVRMQVTRLITSIEFSLDYNYGEESSEAVPQKIMYTSISFPLFHVHERLLNLHNRANTGSATDIVRPSRINAVYILTSDDTTRSHTTKLYCSAHAAEYPIYSQEQLCNVHNSKEWQHEFVGKLAQKNS